jgi:hypothetical protein
MKAKAVSALWIETMIISRKFDKLTQEPDLEATRRSPTVNVDVGSGVGGHPIVMYRWTGAKAARAS